MFYAFICGTCLITALMLWVNDVTRREYPGLIFLNILFAIFNGRIAWSH